MAVVWTPSETDLGTVLENVQFSHTITAYDSETSEEYVVVITALESNPPTISVSENTISGYYTDAFNNAITYLNTDKNFKTVDKFNKIVSAYEMIKYQADTRRTIVYSYRADALGSGESLVYTKTVQNDWTNGKNSLQSIVEELNASSY